MKDSQDIYLDLPNTLLNKVNLNSDEYISDLVKSTIPKGDLQLTNKSVFVLRSKKNGEDIKRRRRKTYVTRKEREELGLLKCPKHGWVYAEFEGLRQLWLQYIRDYLNISGPAPLPGDTKWTNFGLLLSKADYHGAELTVVRSNCPNMVGICGTCVLDTKNTFGILSEDNKFRRIPKENSVFQFILDNAKYTLFGKYLLLRPTERITKKIRTNILPDL